MALFKRLKLVGEKPEAKFRMTKYVEDPQGVQGTRSDLEEEG